MKIHNIDKPTRLIYHNPVSLVTSNYNGQKNVFTVSWLCAISNNPPLVMISVGKERFSYGLIRQSGKFVINIPNIKMKKDVIYCGNVSGTDKDKFKERGLEFSISENGGIILDKTIAFLECEIQEELDIGDHMLFIGKIIDAGAEEDVYKNGQWDLDNENSKVLHFLGQNGTYITIDKLTIK